MKLRRSLRIMIQSKKGMYLGIEKEIFWKKGIGDIYCKDQIFKV